MALQHVQGKNVGHIVLYALSTCPWCKKAKKLLDDLGIEYYYVDVDLLEGTDQTIALDKVKQHNPRCSFPTLVIDSATCIVGFKETEIRDALKS